MVDKKGKLLLVNYYFYSCYSLLKDLKMSWYICFSLIDINSIKIKNDLSILKHININVTCKTKKKSEIKSNFNTETMLRFN